MITEVKSKLRKTSKGSVAVLVSNGRLQLRFHYAGKRHYLSTGLPDSKTNRMALVGRIAEIERDIAYDEVDLTLGKYRTEGQSVGTGVVTPPAPDLKVLWSKYLEFRQPQLAEKTKDWFKTFTNHLQRMPVTTLDQAPQIRDWIVANVAADMGKRMITRLNACCKWAKQSGMIDHNPFEGVARQILLPKSAVSEDYDIDPFTRGEQEEILRAFQNHLQHKVYAPFIEFLLLTGCRPSEAIGLKWGNTSQQKILFKESIVQTSQGKVAKGSTKTGKDRVFPVNKQLEELLNRIKPKAAQPQDFVFFINQEPLNYAYFYKAWSGYKFKGKRVGGIIYKLAEQGLIQRVRNPYQCRHTFITQCLERGISVPQLAKWVGNSPEVILKHYAGVLTQVQVPKF